MSDDHDTRNHETRSHETRNTALAFLAGAVSGGIAALLLAPARGSETREKIRESAGQTLDKGQRSLTGAAESVQGTARDVSETARDKAADLKEGAGDQLDAVKSAVKVGAETYREELGQREREHEA